MKEIYRILQISITIINIAVAALVLTSIYPFVTGNFQVHLPDDSDVGWYYDDGVVTLSAPVGITNGGFYDVTDVRLHVEVENISGFKICDSVSDWGTIQAGSEFMELIEVSVDIVDLLESGAYWMIFNRDYLDVSIEFNCKYTLGLIKFDAFYQVAVQWDGLIQDISFGSPELVNSSGEFYVRVPYTIATDDILSGLGDFSLEVFNDTSSNPIASCDEQIALGTEYDGELALSVAPDVAFDLLFRNQTLTVEIEVGFRDFSVETVETVDWVAPTEMVIE